MTFRLHLPSALAGAGALALCGLLVSMRQTVGHERVYTLTAEQYEILSHMSLVDLDDGAGNPLETIRISGVNLQVVNGSDDTETADGLGNLIVGYNELGNFQGDFRTGSHNLVVGKALSYTQYGALVAGEQNNAMGPYASVVGGQSNTASGAYACVAGGVGNGALDYAAKVCGGQLNTAGAAMAVAVGGRSNVAQGTESVVCAGEGNQTTADFAAVLGGAANSAMGPAAVVCGGSSNVSSGSVAVVTGGTTNAATALNAVVSGGNTRTASGDDDWVAGSLFEDN